MNEIADKIAAAVIARLAEATSGKITLASITTQYGTHIVLKAVADALGVERNELKRKAGIGQPGAYFI